ncbi:DHH family phosphoesterase [Psychrosphaera haliotis]|uniref:DHH family phosphoesterase n=1 Tax=Psychrosphaera haliotis TaxID=555083 RepID=A0A6N8F3W3_9GAMM|nr:DHH family phosphoesterase [Psychrosphaera haliotis]MUH71356.1 DHH family phosphoesterase [Psychrosphaera haliotis]
MNFDVFNGDADGIISLLQLRFHEPKETQLVTGIKRDISLVKQIPLDLLNDKSEITVLDVSMEKNIDALNKVLETKASVLYADHHRAGIIPTSNNLSAHIDLSADTCTGLIVDTILNKQYHNWAITAAYGDNLISTADNLANQAGINSEEAQQLRELGTLINYNGYGAHTDDLAYHPAELFKSLLKYPCPFDCIADTSSAFYKLKEAFDSDFSLAEQANVVFESDQLMACIMPDEAWSRRISGTYGNHLANQFPNRAHLVFTIIDNEHYLVSLRAPLNNKKAAGELCAKYPTGGGREGAAGINCLPKAEINTLIQQVCLFYTPKGE